MATAICDQIDDYLDGVLDPSAADRFVGHLPNCAACRESVQFEQALSAAAQTADRQIALPVSLAGRTHEAIRRWEHRRRLTWTVGIAATVVISVTLMSRLRERNAAPEQQQVAQDVVGRPSAVPEIFTPETQSPDEVLEPMPPPEKAIVRVQSAERPSYIAVPQPTQSDNVTFVMLLPTIGRREPPVDGSLRPLPDDLPFHKGTLQ